VVGLEGRAVGTAERVGELLGRLGHVLAEGDASELEASATEGLLARSSAFQLFVPTIPNQPYQAFSRNMRTGLELVTDQVLEVLGLEGGSEVAFADFLGGNRG
jgi:hypothetical protein